jgi:enhancing lycopene biosynthesis protein 2
MRVKPIVILLALIIAVTGNADSGKGTAAAKNPFEKLTVGVLVYGAGMMDGSEVQEVVLTMLALDAAKAKVVFFAPTGNQADVVDHNTYANVPSETRNMIVESARITHGNVIAMDQIRAEDLDALILPGGLGFIKSVTTYGRDGVVFSMDPILERLLVAMHAAKKPIGFLCITPIAAAKLFGNEHVTLTLGNNADMIAQVESMGARHVEAGADEIVIDRNARIVSSPAYMVGPDISTVARGITKCVWKVLEMALCSKGL